MMDLVLFRKKAKRRAQELVPFLDKLDEIVPEDLPALVAKQDAAVWTKVDCTECANCCKVMTPTFNNEDIKRIAQHLGMKPNAFTRKWLKKEDASGDWVNQTQPCQFLDGNRCSIYEVRPKDCAEFPHHTKKPFDAYNETYKNNLPYCPATFLLISRLKTIVERDYEW